MTSTFASPVILSMALSLIPAERFSLSLGGLRRAAASSISSRDRISVQQIVDLVEQLVLRLGADPEGVALPPIAVEPPKPVVRRTPPMGRAPADAI
jgi:hypothetical protein